MNILFAGDVVGSGGCSFVEKNLRAVKQHYAIDFTVINAENSAVGNGVTPASADWLLDAGADVLTLGNHGLRRREIYPYLDNENNPILRPYNLHKDAPGRGMLVICKGAAKIGVLNLMGLHGMESIDNPFNTVDAALEDFAAQGCNIILVDFHAEATGEKRAMGFYLDGKVTAVLGTHTHVPTADEQILPGGTAYITDVGMTGPLDSCLGIRKELAIEKMRTLLPVRFENPDNPCAMQAVVIHVDEQTGKAAGMERIEVS
ncbi:MAG: TIGR00282 family metallophosphoesterase [Clostridia bacterium]|nr:TIGR00282 family metallophosphoesterase [Clostridia bacterium]